MRQTGIFAACGLLALEDWREHLQQDHENARFLANELATIPGIDVDPSIVETNILRFHVHAKVLKSLKCDYR